MKNDETMPDEIWLIEDYIDGVKGHTWCTDPNPCGAPDTVSTRYTRADRPDPELAEVREALFGIANLRIARGGELRDENYQPIRDFYALAAEDMRTLLEKQRGLALSALAILDRKIGGA